MVTKEISKKGIEMEAFSLEDVKVLETIEDFLCIFFFGSLLFLIINHKIQQVFDTHGAIFRELIKEVLDFRWRFCHTELEYSLEKEAELESLL